MRQIIQKRLFSMQPQYLARWYLASIQLSQHKRTGLCIFDVVDLSFQALLGFGRGRVARHRVRSFNDRLIRNFSTTGSDLF